MTQYRNRPVLIDAQQFLGGVINAGPILKWINENGGKAVWCGAIPEHKSQDGRMKHQGLPESLRIKTQDGWMMTYEGDFIIRTEKGCFYPCRPDDFDEMYEDIPSVIADVVVLQDWNNQRINPRAI